MTEFERFIQNIRSDNPEEFEGAYWKYDKFIKNHLDEIIDIMHDEEDPELRSRFIELIGEANSNAVIPILQKELKNQNRDVRSWAYVALGYIETAEAEQARFEYKKNNPDEDFY